jgi:hypothetical protein
MKLFQQLGNEIERLWLEQNYKEEIFPALAADALRRNGLPSKLSAWDVLEWTVKEKDLPRQRDVQGRFGDPPITIFSAPRFHIDVYFWFNGTTATHQHGFCGAFQVLLGSSIHSWYEFELREAVNAFCEIGDINLKVCEILELGDVQEIRSGRRYIHSLFHLDQPSATIVVRTDRSPLELPQFSYHKPSLAIDPFFEQDETTKKLQAMSALVHAKREEADSLISDWLAQSDFQTSFHILSQLRSLLRSDQMGQMFRPELAMARFEQFLNLVVNRHANKGEVLKPVFARMDMLDEIVQRRGYVTDPEHRFFMALLLNVDGRERIFDLIRHRFPDTDPREKVLDWVFDLSQIRVLGHETSNALGIPGFAEPDIFALEHLLKGKTNSEIEQQFAVEYAGTDVEVVVEAVNRLRRAVIFRPLLSS